jgi:DNA repair protein RadA/Sms
MARALSAFVCQTCGTVAGKWAGRCEGCGAWNTLLEEPTAAAEAPGSGLAAAGSRPRGEKLQFASLAAQAPPLARFISGLDEFDRVCGGGVVPASAILVGGDPGVGKSTLLLQAAAALARTGARVAYVTGEEAEAQVQDRARRLGVAEAPVELAAETDLRKILEALKRLRPDLVVIDSVQTLWADGLSAAPGSVLQVRACAHELVRFAKKQGCAVVLVGHVTKDGQIAGPRVVEHLVDAVLYFEGERGMPYRVLRAVKNRYGPTDEIGVFEMVEGGLQETPNPSALFLGAGRRRASGAAVFAGVEGTRPVLTEIQALAAPAQYGSARRAVVGWDSARLAMILAVLETRVGLAFGGRDVYLSVSGGLRISEPAADLAVAAALISALSDTALPEDCIVFGELALSGDVRPASRPDARLKEAAKLGFAQALAPTGAPGGLLQVRPIAQIRDLVGWIERFGGAGGGHA